MMDPKAVMNANMNATKNAKSEVLAESEFDMQESKAQVTSIMATVEKAVLHTGSAAIATIAAIQLATIEAQPPKQKTNHHSHI